MDATDASGQHLPRRAACTEPEELFEQSEPNEVRAGVLYSMKQTCELTGLSYDTVKFYCKQGLVPGVTRDERNYRMFDWQSVLWLRGLAMLRKCGLTVRETRRFARLRLDGQDSLPERLSLLELSEARVREHIEELHSCLDYLAKKQQAYRDVLASTHEPEADEAATPK